MNIVEKKSDKEILDALKKATSLREFGTFIGYKVSKKGMSKYTKDKIRNRFNKMGIENFQEIFKINLDEKINNFKENIKLIDCSNLDKNGIGFLGESEFVSSCAKNNIAVSKPLYDNYPYDFIIDYKEKLFKVQVKASSQYDVDTGVTSFSLERTANNGQYSKSIYKENDYDLLFLYSAVLGEAYLLKFTDQTSIQIRKFKTRNNQEKKIIYADDVLFDDIIKTI